MKDKKWSLLVSAAFFSTLVSTQVMASDYSNHPLRSGIEDAIQRGIIVQSDKVFPQKEITRAEFASMIVRTTGVSDKSLHQFDDVPKNHLYYQDIQKAFAAKLIFGHNDKQFKPDEKITREEMALMIVRFVTMNNLPIPNVDVKYFNDNNKMRYADTILVSRKLGIVAGYEDNSFRPKQPITKAESLALLIRSIQKVEKHEIELKRVEVEKEKMKETEIPKLQNPDVNGGMDVYKVYFRSKSPIETNSYQSALSFYANAKEDSYIEKNGEIIKLTKGFGRTKGFTLIYDEQTNSNFTYVSADVEMDVVEVKDSKVIVSIGGYKGYVYKNDIELIPFIKSHERSHYINENGYLYHRVYKNNRYEAYKVGTSPLFMERGLPYYTSEGYVFDGQEAYQYFNYLPLRTKSIYTGEELDRYIASKSPDSPLNGYGQTFVSVAEKYNMNAMYLLSHAILESGWGKSKIALEKKNLFGFKAIDANAYGNATSFNTLAEGIDYCAKYISEKYLTPEAWTYQNAILGNKGKGMNVKYASDPYWGAKIAAQMNAMDELLGNKEKHKYQIGEAQKNSSVYIKSGNSLVKIKSFDTKRIVAVQGIEKVNSTDYIRIFSDDTNYPFVYLLPSQINFLSTY